MNVVILVHGFPPEECSGSELVSERIARELVGRGHGVLPVVARWNSRRPRLEIVRSASRGLEIADIFHPRGKSTVLSDVHIPGMKETLSGILSDYGPDVVLIRHLIRFSLSAVEACLDRKIPFVLNFGDYWPICPRFDLLRNGVSPCDEISRARACWDCLKNEGYDDPPPPHEEAPYFLRRETIRMNLDRAASWVFPSRYLLERHRAAGFALRDAYVLPHAVPSSSIEAGNNRAEGAMLKVGFFGTASRMKGYPVLAEALRGVRGVDLHVHGHLPEPAILEEAPGIHYHGPYRDSECLALMARVDLVAVPSIWEEGFGSIVQHAFAAGRPVLASRIGGLPEQFEKGGGWLLPPGDPAAWRAAIEELKEPGMREKLSATVPAPNSFPDYIDRIEAILASARETRS